MTLLFLHIAKVADVFDHLDEEQQSKSLRSYMTRQLSEAEKRRIKAIERQNQLSNNTLVPSD